MASFQSYTRDQKLIAEARSILNGCSAKVYKPTRCGFTTSAVMAAKEDNRPILCVSPTNRILLETIGEASDGTETIIPANHECPRIKEMIGHDKFLENLSIPLPDCNNCTELGYCPVTRVIRDGRNTIIGITYQKLQALMLSKSNIAKKIKTELSRVDIVMLDEAHAIVLSQIVRVKAFAEVVIPSEFSKLNKIWAKWVEFNDEIKEKISDLRMQGASGHVGKHLSIFTNIQKPLNFRQLIAATTELFELARNRRSYAFSERDILTLRDIISLMAGHWISITYLSEPEGGGDVYLVGNYWIWTKALKEFLTKIVPRATHLYVSGTLIEHYPGFFFELSGKDVVDVVFPDLRSTNKKMRIYPDTWKLNSHNFNRELNWIVEHVVEIIKFYTDQDIYIVAPNVHKAAKIKEKLKERLGDAAPSVDYYRSDQTMGVKKEARICIAIGLAEVPSNTYDHLTIDWIESQRLRLESVQAATWQTWSRVKDPNGEVESKVYCIGVRADQISDVVTWGPGRRLDLSYIQEFRLPDGRKGKTPRFRVLVGKPIEPPTVHAENRTSTLRDRHTVDEYIDRVENNDPNLIFSEFVDKMPIDYNRRNVHKLGIYNNPQNIEEREATAVALGMLFGGRFDNYARQYDEPDKEGRYGYNKHRLVGDVFQELEEHLQGRYTIGFYQINLNDEVKWICFDIDDHENTKGAEGVRTDLRRLFGVLNLYNIPFGLESSGSPNSYHVWVFLKPTKTINAYLFARQIKKEAGIECEVFPKQRRLNKNNAFGNLVKVPLGVHRKTLVRSQFLDPETFEPYTGEVPFPGLVRLREITESASDSQFGKRVRGRHESSTQLMSPMLLGQNFRPCMRTLIESGKQLDGSEGHIMRVAIAAEAWNLGMPIEDAIELFKAQEDFNSEKTQAKLEEIYARHYHPYPCETLRDQCTSLVTSYCNGCPRNRVIEANIEDECAEA